jgi:hypothetical protein
VVLRASSFCIPTPWLPHDKVENKGRGKCWRRRPTANTDAQVSITRQLVHCQHNFLYSVEDPASPHLWSLDSVPEFQFPQELDSHLYVLETEFDLCYFYFWGVHPVAFNYYNYHESQLNVFLFLFQSPQHVSVPTGHKYYNRSVVLAIFVAVYVYIYLIHFNKTTFSITRVI